MEDGASKGSSLAVVLTVAGALVLIVLGIFVVMKFLLNEGSADLQKSLSVMSEQVYKDFDQKRVTGSQVTSALTTFNGKPVAILVQTRAFRDRHPIAQASEHPFAYIVTDNTGGATSQYINYNAILRPAGASDATNETTLRTATRGITGGTAVGTTAFSVTTSISSGIYSFTNGFQTVNGNILYDNVTAGVNRSGNSEFITATSSFQANLMKDASGEIVGIVFRQLDN